GLGGCGVGGTVAGGSPGAGGRARGLCRARAGLRRDQAAGLAPRCGDDKSSQRKAPDLRSGACSCAVPPWHQKRRFAPPRNTLVVNDTLLAGARPQLRPQLKLPRSTERDSAFRLTLLTKPTSRPAPTGQPAVLMLPPGKN